MPGPSPTDLAARPTQRSLVLVQPTGLLVTMALLGLGFEAGLALLLPALGYGALYYLGRTDADLTA